MYTYEHHHPFATETILAEHADIATDTLAALGAVRVVAAVSEPRAALAAMTVKEQGAERVLEAYDFLRGMGDTAVRSTASVYAAEGVTQLLAFRWGALTGSQAAANVLSYMAKYGEQTLPESIGKYAARLKESKATGYQQSDRLRVEMEAANFIQDPTQRALAATTAMEHLYDQGLQSEPQTVAALALRRFKAKSYEQGRSLAERQMGSVETPSSFGQNVLNGCLLTASPVVRALVEGGHRAAPDTFPHSRRTAYQAGVYSALAFGAVILEQT